MKDISFLYALSPGDEDRLRVEATVDHGKLQDFVVQYEGKVDNEWQPIVRYDTTHGFAHRDIYRGSKQQLKQILPIQDFNDAFTFALNDIKLQWQSYRERFERELPT